jgi:hypothetical protein
MPSTISRDRIVSAVHEALAPLHWVRAVWLGGSDATGRTDDWSDVDLMVLVEDGRTEDAFGAVSAALAALSPISIRHRRAPGPGEDFRQEFLALADADPAHFVDLTVLPASTTERFLELERHGTPLVLFDRDGTIRPEVLDRDTLGRRMAARLAVLRERFPIFQTLVTRAVRRGQVATAADAYASLTLRPLVTILRMRHCPDRFDFGVRYLDRDLPPDLAAEVDRLALPGTLEEVEENRARAAALFAETLAAIDAR